MSTMAEKNAIIKDLKERTTPISVPVVTVRGGVIKIQNFDNLAWAQAEYKKNGLKVVFDGVNINGKRFTGEADWDTYLHGIGYAKKLAEATRAGRSLRPAAGAAAAPAPKEAPPASAAAGAGAAAPAKKKRKVEPLAQASIE